MNATNVPAYNEAYPSPNQCYIVMNFITENSQNISKIISKFKLAIKHFNHQNLIQIIHFVYPNNNSRLKPFRTVALQLAASNDEN